MRFRPNLIGQALLGLLASSACTSAAPRLTPSLEPTAPALLAATRAGCASNDAVDVLDHAIELSLRLHPAALSGRGALLLRARRATRSLALDAQGLHVTSVNIDARPLAFEQIEQRVCITLPEPLAAQAQLTLKLTWDVPTAREQPHFTSTQAWAGYRAAAWMPTLQDPAQRATLALTLTAPASLKVAASGQLLARVPAGPELTQHSFLLSRPTPPFLFAFAAGAFAEAELLTDGATLRAFGPHDADLAGALAITAQMHHFFVQRLGSPLPAPEYLQVFVQGDAAQEAAGFALLSETALIDVKADPHEDWIFAHELAHQWFGWLVPCADFSDFWLNEGFATFLVAAFKEQRWGRAAYERELELWRARSAKVDAAPQPNIGAALATQRATALSLSNPAAPPHAPPSEAELQPRGVTYARGALLLDKLRRQLGETAFWSGLRLYVKQRAGLGATSEDLRRALETASGRDLQGFFEKWVYRPAPDL